MKKSKVVTYLVLIMVLLVSCVSTGNRSKSSFLDKVGKDGDIVITGKTSVDKVERFIICISDESIYGTVEGTFSKLEGYIAYKNANLDLYGIKTDELDYYQPSKGLLVFSSDDAKTAYSDMLSRQPYVDNLSIDLMEESDLALYSRYPSNRFPYLEKAILYENGLSWSADFKTSDEGKTNGLFTALKSSYVSYLTKNRLTVDINKLNECFSVSGDTVYIKNMPLDDGYLLNFAEEFLGYGTK